MKQIWEQAILFYNLPLTVLLVLVFCFWLFSLLGAIDLDFLDFDFDTDTDGADGGAFGFLLRCVNAQDVPVMIILSLLTLFMWAIAVASNSAFNPDHNGWLAVAMLLGNFFTSVCLVKAVTQPLRPLMRALKNDKEHQEPLVGMSGVVKSRVLDHNFGQVEVARDKGAPALLNAVLPEGRDALVRGDQILVIDFDKERDKFLVHPEA